MIEMILIILFIYHSVIVDHAPGLMAKTVPNEGPAQIAALRILAHISKIVPISIRL